MCHYISLIVPGAATDALAAVLAPHGRVAIPIENPSLRRILRDDERAYLTKRGDCDCGTVLAGRERREGEDGFAREAARLKRKGWSDAKIARAIEDIRKADARPRRRATDSVDLWDGILGDLKRRIDTPYAGLFVRFYAEAVDTESFEAVRREVPLELPRREALGSIVTDELTIFPLR